MIVSFNFYYARPGLADAVLQQRLRASEVRVQMKVPYGRVMKRAAGAGELPDVIWAHEFAEVGGHHADMAARAASPEFEAIRAGMRPLLRRFERPLFEVRGAAASTLPVALPRPAQIVTLDWIFCGPQKGADILAVLDRYVGLYAKRGLNGGRLLHLVTPDSNLPEVVWQHDYADAPAHNLMQAELASCAELLAWHTTVGALAHSVRPSVWQIEGPR